MRFQSFDSLSVFNVVARHMSITSAAHELNLSKGAVSYQIKRLESALGFEVFVRQHGGIALTEKGRRLWHSSQSTFNTLEQKISSLRAEDAQRITIGMSTYFASRWLSPRLMMFMNRHPEIGIRLQPMIDLYELSAENMDIAIRWGKGDWSDVKTELLLPCPAFPTASIVIAELIDGIGIRTAMGELKLMHDHENSEAWHDWHNAAQLPYKIRRDDLVIPDPNVRVQAVINGQGVALNDSLVQDELTSGDLVQISDVELVDYGYFLAYPGEGLLTSAAQTFRDWIVEEARNQPSVR